LEEVVVRDNRDVFDDGTAQQLTAQEIKEVRGAMSSKVTSSAKSAELQDIISTISANNSNFNKKSVFSQEKYVRSKVQRFLRAFTPIQPTVGNVCEYLWAERRDKCMYIAPLECC